MESHEKIKFFIILIVVIALIILGIVIYRQIASREVIDISSGAPSCWSSETIAYRFEGNRIIFFCEESNTVINEYECRTSSCQLSGYGELDSSSFATSVFLIEENIQNQESGNLILFNVVNGGIKLETNLILLLHDNRFIFRQNERYGIIDNFGNKITEAIFDNHSGASSSTSVNTGGREIRFVALSQNNLFGLINIQNGNVLVNFEYERIHVFESNFVSVLKNQNWYVLDTANQDNKNETRFQEIFISGNYFLGSQNNLLNLYNAQTGERLTNAHIPLGIPYNPLACCGASSGMSLFFPNTNRNYITIFVEDAEYGDFDQITRVYNFNRNTRVVSQGWR